MSDEGFSTSSGDQPATPRLSRWQKFRIVLKVVELRVRFVALMAATGLVFAYWDTLWNHYEKYTRPADERHVVEAGSEYYCPMHPSVVQAEPGSCPICGMPLSRRTPGEQPTLPAGVISRIALAPGRIAQAGIQTAQVGYHPLAETLTTVGQVGFDERRLARISLKTRGEARVDKLLVNFTGTPVEAGQPLAELYSPELYQAVQELLLAQKAAREGNAPQSALGRSLLGDGTDLVRLAREKLAHWGMTPRQVDEILAQGKTDARIPILSPIGGVVVKKNVFEGQYVQYGEAMFEVADLSHVWIWAQVYEDQVGLLRDGQPVEAKVEAFPGEAFKGTVAYKDPALNPATRTLGVRYDLENRDGRLRPGMFATVTLRTPVADLPAFRARVAHAAGAHAGHEADPSVDEQKICPVTRAKLGSMGDPIAVRLASRKVWVCCGGCPDTLKSAPAKYLARLEEAPKDAVLTVPEAAVVDAGTRKLVFVEGEPGVFEEREVVLGPRSGENYPVLEGLAPGEKVAAAGAFLIDAETRLKGASGGPAPASRPSSDPTATAATPSSAAGHRH